MSNHAFLLLQNSLVSFSHNKVSQGYYKSLVYCIQCLETHHPVDKLFSIETHHPVDKFSIPSV